MTKPSFSSFESFVSEFTGSPRLTRLHGEWVFFWAKITANEAAQSWPPTSSVTSLVPHLGVKKDRQNARIGKHSSHIDGVTLELSLLFTLSPVLANRRVRVSAQNFETHSFFSWCRLSSSAQVVFKVGFMPAERPTRLRNVEVLSGRMHILAFKPSEMSRLWSELLQIALFKEA